MKKLLALALALATMISSITLTVSAADHTDETEIETASVEIIGPEEALEIMNDRLGYETGYSLVQWGPNYWGLAFVSYHTSDYWWEITTYGEEWQMSLEDFEEELARFEEQGLFDVPLVKKKEYQRNGWSMIYGDEVEYEWLPLSKGGTVVEIYFDVESKDFLTTEDVSELFYEEFGYDVRVSEIGTYFDAFRIEDLHSTKEYLIPVKEEGMPIEVWYEFVNEFANEFIYDYDFFNEEEVAYEFEEILGYRPEVSVFRWGEDDVTIDVTFDHLGGKTYCLEAVYVEKYDEYCVTDVALEKFVENHPECTVVPNFTWEQLLRLLDFYHNW